MGNFKRFIEGINISNIKVDMSFLDKLISKKIKISKLIKLLNSELSNENVLFLSEKSDYLGINDLSVYGSYAQDIDDESDGDEQSILIYILHKGDSVIMMDSNISYIKIEIPKVINHESIHMQQARKRWFEYQKVYYSKNHPKAYLSNDDEIEAYANDIAEDILSEMDKEKAIKFLKKPRKGVSKYLDEYLDTFDNNHVVIKKLFKKIVLYINSKERK